MEINKSYTELLILIAPGPLGQGLTIKEAAKQLNIPYRTAQNRLASFNRKYPNAYKKFKDLQRLMRQDRLKLRWDYNKLREIKLHLFSEMLDKPKHKDNDKPISYIDYDDYMNIKEKL